MPVPELPVPLPLDEGLEPADPLMPVALLVAPVPLAPLPMVRPPVAPELVPLAGDMPDDDDDEGAELADLDDRLSQAASPSAATVMRGTATKWRSAGILR